MSRSVAVLRDLNFKSQEQKQPVLYTACFSRRCEQRLGLNRVTSGLSFPPHLAVVHHHDALTAHHGVEAVGDDQRGAAVERAADRLLDQPVRLAVDGSGGLVQQQDLWEQQQLLMCRPA